MRTGVRAIVLKDGKILLGRRLKKGPFHGMWCTFGGFVEPNETPLQALTRELYEELGIETVNPEPLTFIETMVEDLPSRYKFQSHFFLVRNWKGEITNKSEHSRIRWFSRDELKDLPMGWVGRSVIEKYLKEISIDANSNQKIQAKSDKRIIEKF